MRRFVTRENIRLLERQLRNETDGHKRARLEEMLVDAQRELSRLENIWSWTCPHITVPDHVGRAAERLLEFIVQGHGADFGSLQVWDKPASGLFLIAHRNFDSGSAEQFAVVRDGDGTVCEAAQALRAPVIIEDIEKEQSLASLRTWTRHMGIRAIHTTPVFGPAGEFLGAFSTHYADVRSLNARDQQLNAGHARGLSLLLGGLRRG